MLCLDARDGSTIWRTEGLEVLTFGSLGPSTSEVRVGRIRDDVAIMAYHDRWRYVHVLSGDTGKVLGSIFATEDPPFGETARPVPSR